MVLVSFIAVWKIFRSSKDESTDINFEESKKRFNAKCKSYSDLINEIVSRHKTANQKYLSLATQLQQAFHNLPLKNYLSRHRYLRISYHKLDIAAKHSNQAGVILKGIFDSEAQSFLDSRFRQIAKLIRNANEEIDAAIGIHQDYSQLYPKLVLKQRDEDTFPLN